MFEVLFNCILLFLLLKVFDRSNENVVAFVVGLVVVLPWLMAWGLMLVILSTGAPSWTVVFVFLVLYGLALFVGLRKFIEVEKLKAAMMSIVVAGWPYALKLAVSANAT